MESIAHQRVKVLIAGLSASAVVLIGAVAAIAVGQQQTGTVAISPMTMGATAATTTPPTAPPTAQAHPGLKATRPNGF